MTCSVLDVWLKHSSRTIRGAVVTFLTASEHAQRTHHQRSKLFEHSPQIVDNAPRVKCLNAALHLLYLLIDQRLPPASVFLGATLVTTSRLP